MATFLKLGWLGLAIAMAPCLTLALSHEATAAIFHESEKGDAGSLLGNAMRVNTQSGDTPLNGIVGTLGNQADVYQIYIDHSREFLATTEHRNNPFDFNTQLFLFNQNGYGLYANDDTSIADPSHNPTSTRSTIRVATGGLSYSGIYYLAISNFNLDPIWTPNQFIFPQTRRALFGPGNAAQAPLSGWQISASSALLPLRAYTIALQGARYVPALSPIPNQPAVTPPQATPAPSPSPSPVVSASPVPVPAPAPVPAPVPTPAPVVTQAPAPAPVPVPTPTPTPASASTPDVTPTPSPAPTPAPSSAPTPASTSTPDVTPTLSVTVTPIATPSPSSAPTSAPVSVPEPSLALGMLVVAVGSRFAKRTQRRNKN